ncbi:MAG: hypothetical protein LBF84_01550 [Holosporales bacterium]|nr:hypothetical protein [Holosporales bacterium]
MSNFEEFLGAYEAQNRSVLSVREDSSIGATLKLPKERSFRNGSNPSRILILRGRWIYCINTPPYLLPK